MTLCCTTHTHTPTTIIQVCEVQSDKANVEITSRFAGVVATVHHKVGDMAQVRLQHTLTHTCTYIYIYMELSRRVTTRLGTWLRCVRRVCVCVCVLVPCRSLSLCMTTMLASHTQYTHAHKHTHTNMCIYSQTLSPFTHTRTHTRLVSP